MKRSTLALALAASTASLPGLAQNAAVASTDTLQNLSKQVNDNACVQLYVYSVNQVCQQLSNGLAQCQPVGMVGPAPNCTLPKFTGLTPVPLAPPVLQPFPTQPYTGTPYAGTPHPGWTFPFPSIPAAAHPVAPTPGQSSAATLPAPLALAKREAAPLPAASQPASAPTALIQDTSSQNMPAPAVSAVPAAPMSSPDRLATQPEPLTVLAHFDFDSAALSTKDRDTLAAWAHTAKKQPVRISGHADRFGSEVYNLALSQRRAETVARYLAEQGFKIEKSKVVALGEREPLVRCKGAASAATKDCLAPNRRVEVRPE
jgi:outer membrane protein OmpA-like peptidoglycan-associated protein